MSASTYQTAEVATSNTPAVHSIPSDILWHQIDPDKLKTLSELRRFIFLGEVVKENHDKDYAEFFNDADFRHLISLSGKAYVQLSEKMARHSSGMKKVSAAHRYLRKKQTILNKLRIARRNATAKVIARNMAKRKKTKTGRDEVQYPAVQNKQVSEEFYQVHKEDFEEPLTLKKYMETHEVKPYVPGEFRKKQKFSEALMEI